MSDAQRPGRARAIWTGSLSFGLVNVPVGRYSATSVAAAIARCRLGIAAATLGVLGRLEMFRATTWSPVAAPRAPVLDQLARRRTSLPSARRVRRPSGIARVIHTWNIAGTSWTWSSAP